MNEIEKEIAAAMDAGQIDDNDVKNNDVESDLLKAAEGMPAEEIIAPEPKEGEETPPKDGEETPPKDGEEKAPAKEEAAPKEGADPDVKIDKAPAGWTPANREHWAGLPDGLKSQIAKREKEISTALQSSSNDRKLASAFTQTAAPYASLIAAEGAQNPLQAFKGLLDTASTLKMGSATQKAQKITDLIKHYGVDIGTLDTILSGQAPTPDGGSDMEQMITKRLQPLEEVINGYKSREQDTITAQNTKTMTDIDTFAEANEFFADVRSMMADAMDMAAKQGRSMSLKEAYDFSCSMTPEIKSVMDTRAKQNDLGRKKEAAGSLHFKRGGNGGKEVPQSLEAQIEAAWDNAE